MGVLESLRSGMLGISPTKLRQAPDFLMTSIRDELLDCLHRNWLIVIKPEEVHGKHLRQKYD